MVDVRHQEVLGAGERAGRRTVRGVMSIFPRDIGRGEDGEDRFKPGARALVYPTAPIARKYGDWRAPQRAVEFEVAPDEFFAVHRYNERNAAGPTVVSVGSFTDYSDAYAALVDRVPAGNRAEIRIMTPTRAEVIATGKDGEDVVIGESLTWQARAIADRVRFVDPGR
jgi:hypothetical protein